MGRPTYDELAELVAGQAEQIRLLRAEVEVLKAENTELRARVAELEARLKMNSQNSSKPPSSDGLAKPPAPKSLRTKSGRKPGGQPGHQGRTLEQIADPDEVIRHEPSVCSGCGADASQATETDVERRQVFDIPPTAVRVIEHQIITRTCRCGASTRGVEPAQANAPVQYGPRIRAIIVYLYIGQFLSKDRTAKALADLFGVPVSAGTVANTTADAAAGLGEFTDIVREQITASEVVHFDETGFRVAGRLRWIHSASTGKYSLLLCHDKRGVAAMDAMGVLPRFGGLAVHDAWAPYDHYTSATHVLCNAHLLRELNAVVDTAPPAKQSWARQARAALGDLKDLVDTAKAAGRHTVARAAGKAVAAFTAAAEAGLAHNTDATTPIGRKHRALARRMLKRQNDYLRFVRDFAAPFDNNQAERSVRMAKLRQKISGSMRTLTGAEQFCAIRSYTGTAAKHGLTTFDALEQLMTGRPWLPATP